MAAGCGDLESTPHQRLAPDFGHIGDRRLRSGEIRDRPPSMLAKRHRDRLAEIAHRTYGSIVAECNRLGGRLWRQQTRKTKIGGDPSRAETASHCSHLSVECQLTEGYHAGRPRLHMADGDQHPDGNGEVVCGATLGDVSRGQVDDDPAIRERPFRGLESGDDPLPGLSNCGVGQPDNVKCWLAPADEHLDIYLSRLGSNENN